jgi:hypothetical protein
MSIDNNFPHKWIDNSPYREHLLFASSICGNKKMVCSVTVDVSDNILEVMIHNFLKNVNSDV